MYGLPGPPIIDEGEQEKLVASVSLALEPPEGTGGPFIAISYEISLRVFCIALALSRLEKKAEPKNKTGNDNNDDKMKAEGNAEKNRKKGTHDNAGNNKKSSDNAASSKQGGDDDPKQGERK